MHCRGSAQITPWRAVLQDNRDQLDRVLDSALATYADPGPDSGLERRILSRIANEATPAPRRRWLAWAIALPVAAGLLMFMIVSHSWTNQPATTPETNASRQSARPSIETANRPVAHPVPIRRSKASLRIPRPVRKTLAADSTRPPKLDVFPTPQPLTRQEQAFALYAARMADPQRQAIAKTQQSEFEPSLTSVPRLSITSISTLSVASIPTLSLPDTVLLGPPVAVEN